MFLGDKTEIMITRFSEDEPAAVREALPMSTTTEDLIG